MFLRYYLAIAVFGLLSQFVAIGYGQAQSPCPDVFRYFKDESDGHIGGYIEINNVPIGVALHIMMKLSVAVTLPTKYVGKLELGVSREQAIENIEQGRPLLYRVRFPTQHPVPLVTRILFNQQERCTGRRAIGPIVTSITLEHTLFPPGVAPQAPNPSMPNLSPNLHPMQSRPLRPTPPAIVPTLPTRFTFPFTKPTSTTTPSPSPPTLSIPSQTFPPIDWNALPIPDPTLHVPPRGSVEQNNCGRPRKNDINLLISKGDKTQPGDWPWLVAIFVSRIKLEFQCAGSLISDRHVLTAAHCLKTNSGQELPASTLLAVVGRYKLRGWSERGSVTHEISEFKVHAEYGRVGAGFGSDLAVITLMETVTFSRLIVPICLWSGPPDIESIVGKIGFVVGWGRDEDGNPVTEEPRVTKVPIVSQEQCLRSNADFVEITSNRTFCGGSRNGSGPCNGDSGGGMVMYDPQMQRYHLRGVVSLSLLDRATGACDLTQFVVYTDTAKYMDWIQQQISTGRIN